MPFEPPLEARIVEACIVEAPIAEARIAEARIAEARGGVHAATVPAGMLANHSSTTVLNASIASTRTV
jgi:hypothetical protein